MVLGTRGSCGRCWLYDLQSKNQPDFFFFVFDKKTFLCMMYVFRNPHHSIGKRNNYTFNYSTNLRLFSFFFKFFLTAQKKKFSCFFWAGWWTCPVEQGVRCSSGLKKRTVTILMSLVGISIHALSIISGSSRWLGFVLFLNSNETQQYHNNWQNF